MQVILIEDVKSLGKKGDVVKVNDGYARNFILPKKLGLEATPKNLKDLEIQKAEEAQRQKEIYEEAKAFGEEIEKKSVKLTLKAGEGGRVFGSITSKDISDALKAQFDIEIDKKRIVMDGPIKQTGVYTIAAKLYQEVSGKIKVNVTGE